MTRRQPLSSDTVYYIDDVSGPGAGLSGGYTVPAGYMLAFEDNFDDIGQDSRLLTYDLDPGDHQGGPDGVTMRCNVMRTTSITQ